MESSSKRVEVQAPELGPEADPSSTAASSTWRSDEIFPPEPCPTRQRMQPQSQQNRQSLRFDDHFSLRRPSSSVSFRGESVQVFEFRTSQVQIKISNPETVTENSKGHGFVRAHPPNNNNNDFIGCKEEAAYGPYRISASTQIEVKEVEHDRAERLSALRLTYTIVAFFCMATFFCFSVLIILFLFMDMVSDAGSTGENGNVNNIAVLGRVLGTMSAIPVFFYGFTSLMTVWVFFISETWHGFPLLRTIVTDLDEVLIEWVSLIMMLGAPMVTLIINLFRMTDKWWEHTIYVWYISVSVYFAVFTIVVVYCEIEAAWLIVQQTANGNNENENHGITPRSRPWSKIKYFVTQAIKRTQDSVYCGCKVKKKTMSSITEDTSTHAANGRFDDMADSHNLFRRCYTKMSQWDCLSLFFETIDPPERIVSTNDAFSNHRLITRNNWSIEKSLCSSSTNQNVVITKGPGALKQSQIISTVASIGISILGLILIAFGSSRCLQLSLATFLASVVLIGYACSPNLVTMWRFLEAYQKHANQEKEGLADDDNDDVVEDGIYESFDTYRVSRPTQTLRIVFLVLHYGILYFFPITTLIVLENYPVLVVFVVVAIWSSVRYWFDPVNMMTDHRGTTSTFEFENVGRNKNKTPVHQWNDQSRISAILLNVTRAHGTKTYIWTILIIILGMFTLAMGALTSRMGLDSDSAESSGYWEPFRFASNDFVYPPKENLMYPTCRFMNIANIMNNTETTLIDYTFLSRMAYQDPSIQQYNLDEWFGPGVGKFDSNITREFRETLPISDLDVSYDIFSFGDQHSVIVVKGAVDPWEWLTNAQIWAAVWSMEIFLSVLPAGSLFEPILDDVLQALEFLESKSLKEIQLNSQTTGLVNYMRDTVGFKGSLSITGHSLGGGAALITGAQTKIPAVAISGPNNVFSRKTFDSALELDTIDSMLFNVIPDRDFIPRIDKAGLLTQHVACRAQNGPLWDCHNPDRTLCELMVTCGSFGRPPPCECAVKYGYEEPQRVSGDKRFSDVCGTRRSNDGWDAPFVFENSDSDD